MPQAAEEALHEALRAVWDDSEDYEEARVGLEALAAEHEAERPEFAEWLLAEREETLSCFHFPEKHRRRARTTNDLERVNQEIKRRTRVVRTFPNRPSCLRLVSALLKEWHEDWISGRRYLRMEPLYEQEAATGENQDIATAA